MCQYSLEGHKSRAADDYEELVLMRVPYGSGHRGFYAESDPHKGLIKGCLVCIRSGTKLTFKYSSGDRAATLLSRDQMDIVVYEDYTSAPLDAHGPVRVVIGTKVRDLDKVLGMDQIRADLPSEEPIVAHQAPDELVVKKTPVRRPRTVTTIF